MNPCTVASILLGLAVAVLLLRLRKVRREREQAQRAAEETSRALTAFVSQSVEDFFQEGGTW
jgi:uncharacterized membrane protein YccC